MAPVTVVAATAVVVFVRGLRGGWCGLLGRLPGLVVVVVVVYLGRRSHVACCSWSRRNIAI
jgi:hypothetical protein